MPILSFPNARELALSIRATALVFEDARSRELLQRIELIAPSRANVLVIGETGTGKELVARHVHALGPCPDGPFVAVNCGAFSENLAESELFGHERGAFTGAVQAKAGWFETADGGTLFLDEIGDLSLPLQVKLLRVLQEREVTRIGSREPRKIDVRLIAATNVRLEEAVRAGRFREDLYYRLNVATLALRPLRERPGDILPLTHYFLALYTERLARAPVRLSDATERLILTHPWPGNIRQLENVIHHGLLVCAGSELRPQDLNLPLVSPLAPAVEATPTPADALFASSSTAPTSPTVSLAVALRSLFEEGGADLYERIDNEVIRLAFTHCNHNQLRTARMLDMSRNVLRARLARLGLIGTVTAESHTESC